MRRAIPRTYSETTMKNLIIAFALVLVAGLAQADGVPLFTPAPHNKALAQKYQKTVEWAGTTTTVKVNPYALDSNVITATIEGKDYRFVGGKTTTPSRTTIEDGKPVIHSEVTSWSGTAGNDQVLLLTRVEGGVMGDLALNGERYTLMHDGMLIKANYHRTPMKAVPK